uniref:Peptidase A2 domain-containing protein n=1 Tax=Romanomermis culicivorax TaxID=13658 RepID=A0A915KNS9_ROMCU
MVQMIDQIMGAISDQFQAQQLRIQCEIQEQTKAANARFTALAEQMQQLISTTAAATNACNPPTPRPLLVSSQFHGEETRDIYIPNETLCETEPAQVFGRLPNQVKPNAPSMDTLYNNEFSSTACGKEELPRSVPIRRQLPAANHFGFSDYPPDDNYDHPQLPYKMPRTSHYQEDSHIKTIVDNMHSLIIDGAAMNKRLLRFFIHLENEATTSPTRVTTAHCRINARPRNAHYQSIDCHRQHGHPFQRNSFAAPIVSPGIVCWNATGRAFQDPCHIRSSICQIDNLTLSSKTFAQALINTGAQCSALSSRLVKHAFDKQSHQLTICGKIKFADGAVVNSHGTVVVTMESAFGEHMIKCVILDDDGNDQCIMGTDFFAYTDIHAILNFKDK